MKFRLALAISCASVLSAPPLHAEPAAPASIASGAATSAAPQDEARKAEHDKLFALFADADARELALSPLSRLFRGEDENADRLGDFLTDSQFLASRTDTRLNLALLAA
ncbi:MAG: hypothetical protein ACK4MR_07885, partial [Erythrobacter cryptus]